jgi:xylulose-5-phosphate/fructose-6-phosphate phosphoketolase
MATSWHSTKFLNPAADGAVLPILHLNGYKIANPTVLARISEEDLTSLFSGYGWAPRIVAGDAPEQMHQAFAAALDECLDDIAAIQHRARVDGRTERPRWPMIVLRSPKGWTGPATVDGLKVEDFWRSHQVPITDPRTNDDHREALQRWMQSYRPDELFDADGAPVARIRDLHPHGNRRMSANPHANGGVLLRDLRQPDVTAYAVDVPDPGRTTAKATSILGEYLRDVMRLNAASRNFRMFAPDENSSNRLDAVLEVTDRAWNAATLPEDVGLGVDGRLMEILSEHTCQGWLEGYLLTGRHGFFSSYEAFIHIVDSMFNQHAKWLTTSRGIEWRRPVASLNYLLTSHVWRQDHNGFSHQDPGFIDHVVNKKADTIRVYLPPDANTLLVTAHEVLDSRNYVNVVVAGKQPQPQYLSMDAAIAHCTKGIGTWDWASTDVDGDPDLVMACAGDVPTLEALAAVDLLRGFFPDLRIRFVNVVDLMRLQDDREHPHGLSDTEFDSLFTTDRPVIFNYHGYPWLIHRLTYRRTNHDNLHVRGFKEEGTTTTPFDMAVMNQIDRFNLAIDAIDRVPRLGSSAAHVRQHLQDRLIEHRLYTRRTGQDMPQIRDWVWQGATPDR